MRFPAGVLLYEVYTKKRVWEGLRHPQIIHAIAVQKKHPELPDTAPQGYKVCASQDNLIQLLAALV